MAETLIKGLIGLGLLVIAVLAAVWFFGVLGFVIPPNIMPIIWGIVVLIAILVLIRAIRGTEYGSWIP